MRYSPYLFVLPNILIVLAFTSFPLVYNLYLSFHRVTYITGDFIGAANYRRLLTDPTFYLALRHTVYYTLGTVPTSMALALALAVGLNERIVGRTVLRSAYLLPYLFSGVTVGVLWQWIYSPNFGVLNTLLGLVGLPGFEWLQEPRFTLALIVLVGVWAQTGYYMLLYLAGLQSIPADYYDAAACDGANARQRFRFITLPLLRPITYMILILATLTSFKVFDTIYVMTGGGPGNASLVIVMYIYQAAFEGTEMGYAAALSIALFVAVFALTIAQTKALGSSHDA